MLLIIGIAVLPLFIVGVISWRYRREYQTLATWRRILFLIGIALNAVSAIALLTFVMHAYVVSLGTKAEDLDRAYPVLTMLVLGLLATIIGVFGRRASRLLLVGNGLFTSIFWYLAAMGASR